MDLHKARLRAIVRRTHRKNLRRENDRLKSQAAEVDLEKLRELVQAQQDSIRRLPAPLNLSPIDQLFRLALLPEYRRYCKRQRSFAEFQKDYPELVAPIPPGRLMDAVQDAENGNPIGIEAFLSPPVKVLRGFDMDTHPDFDSDNETGPVAYYVQGRAESENLSPGENPAFTFFYKADLIQGRFLHLQINLAAPKGTILDQVERVVSKAQKVVGRNVIRTRGLGKDTRDIIRAAIRLGTTSPSKVAAGVSPALYEKKMLIGVQY